MDRICCHYYRLSETRSLPLNANRPPLSFTFKSHAQRNMPTPVSSSRKWSSLLRARQMPWYCIWPCLTIARCLTGRRPDCRHAFDPRPAFRLRPGSRPLRWVVLSATFRLPEVHLYQPVLNHFSSSENEIFFQTFLRYSLIISAALAPSPAALATCLVLLSLTSPAANIPGTLASIRAGSRF